MSSEGDPGAILTRKDKSIDLYLHRVLEEVRLELEGERDCEEEHTEEYQKNFEERATARLNAESIMLGNKLGSVLKTYLESYYMSRQVSSLGRVSLPRKDLRSFSLDYGECFRGWVLSPHVTYEATNTVVLGNLSPLDCFVLHVWSFLVCYRTRGDNMFALSICGKSSVGKSVIFENIFFENGMNFNGEAGVGRYDAKARSIIVYHDIDIRLLARGSRDADKFKTIARAEQTSAKVHSTVKPVPPLFVVITSNMRIHSHPARTRGCKAFLSEKCPSELTTGSGKSLTSNSENIEAVKNRVLEAYCSARPRIDPQHFPTSGCFRRKNFILGVYGFVLDTAERYRRSDFYSPAFLAYVLTGLAENAAFYCSVMEDGTERMAQLGRVLGALCADETEFLKYWRLVPSKVAAAAVGADGSDSAETSVESRTRSEEHSPGTSRIDNDTSTASSSSSRSSDAATASPASKRPLLDDD